MATSCGGANEVKASLSGATASPSTVATLQALLGLETGPTSGKPTKSVAARPGNAKGAASKATAPASARSRRPQAVAISEDCPKPLSPREKYALATETVNSGLRVLTEATKSALKPVGTSQDVSPSTPSPASRGALQPRPNNITPRRPSPEKVKANGTSASETSSRRTNEQPSYVSASAECTRAAFAFLRTADTQKLGVREMPRLQLENGMLALIGKLIALGLESMAIKELRHVKRRLEALFGSKKVYQPGNLKSRANPAPPERESIASLLQLDADFCEDGEALNLAVTYSFHSLKVTALSCKPTVIQDAAQYLVLHRTNSPADLLRRQAKIYGQTSKIAKQLETLSQTIFSLCPSPSKSSDAIAVDELKHITPETALKLQTLALQIRTSWWRMVDHQADVERELFEPFLRCALTFTRRSFANLDTHRIYRILSECFESISTISANGGTNSTLFNIHSLLSQQAERGNQVEEALRWAKVAVEDCEHLELSHARRLFADIKHISLLLGTSQSNNGSLDVNQIAEGLRRKLTGTAVDFDSLLAGLHDFALSVSAINLSIGAVSDACREVLTLAVGFALRYARSYPGRGTQHVITVINGALRSSKSTDDLLSWVTVEAAMTFVHSGTLNTIAGVASRSPLVAAWAASSDAVSLSRICRALLLSRVRSPITRWSRSTVDDEKLAPEERGALLEMQLESATQLSSKAKYHAQLRQIVSELLQSLSNVYRADQYPIRRARVTVAALRLQEAHPELLTEDILAEWQETPDLDCRQLGSDLCLEPFLEDLRATLFVSKAFAKGSPSFGQLAPALVSWSRILDQCGGSNLRERFEDSSAVAQQLSMIASYLGMRGDQQARLPVLLLLDRLEHLRHSSNPSSCLPVSVDLAMCYLELGHSEPAEGLLAQTNNVSATGFEKMQHQLAYANYFLAIDDLGGCDRALSECRTQRESLTPDKVPHDQRRAYEVSHAQGWLTHSKYALESVSPHEALTQAKRSVKILNSMWATLERADGSRRSNTPGGTSEAEVSEPGIISLTKGISKLQLTPQDEVWKLSESKAKKGAAFWPIVPILTKALLHLSDMYSYHGLFSEANHYSERAITIAESVGSSVLLSRIRSHRARLLAIAGRLEEAELCLTQDEATRLSEPSRAAIERLCALATIRVKENLFEDGLVQLEKARQMIDRLTSGVFVDDMARLDGSSGTAMNAAARPVANGHPSAGTQKTTKAPGKRPAAGAKAGKVVSKRAQPVTLKDPESNGYMLAGPLVKTKADIMLQAMIIRLKLGQDIGDDLSQHVRLPSSGSMANRIRIVEHLHGMAKADAELEMDVTMNVLGESTLSLPSFTRPQSMVSTDESKNSRSRAQVVTKAAARSKKPAPKPKPAAQGQIVSALQAARHSLLQDSPPRPTSGATAHMHLENAMLTRTSMLLSAVCDQQSASLMHPTQQSLDIDQPRMHALQYERQAVNADSALSDVSEPLSWPTIACSPEIQQMTATTFQAEYIDIIPKPWTAVSVCLNDDTSEIYIARYQSQQEPLVLRLPFSRHKQDDVDEEAFDYAKGKTELQEIIELSNYTCHNSRNMDAKGAKDTWWSDREALDRRMHELLINMENIWFGGFKSIFAQIQQDLNLLARFRKSFEDILDRYLPSRQAAKSKTKKLALNDKVLELFIGLGDDQDGVIDLDEPLADLLYFVVDLLQFSGERNAYDEIDFDSMAVDVLDALRSYHEANESKTEDRHLVLVLDRRLQAFPWENMPCLEGENVSRVGSMQSLRECITAMRASQQIRTDKLSFDGEGCHVASRTSGTYILNPSSDLKATQTMLSPALQSLANSSGQPWTSIVNEAPDEHRFSAALQDSSVLLYFGHGAGSQYIRPRAIKRLESCSEVVWLMGCSSGAVTENGDLEPSAVPHAYLLAGTLHERIDNDISTDGKTGGKCMSVLATLWDVTDKDIDRFSLAVGEEWGLWPPSEQAKLPAKTPKKRAARQIVAPSTPQQVPKTPKTPKVRKTPTAAVAKTPAQARSRGVSNDVGTKKRSLVQAVARSREACYLRYLNGAAAVVYGVPVYLGD